MPTPLVSPSEIRLILEMGAYDGDSGSLPCWGVDCDVCALTHAHLKCIPFPGMPSDYYTGWISDAVGVAEYNL